MFLGFSVIIAFIALLLWLASFKFIKYNTYFNLFFQLMLIAGTMIGAQKMSALFVTYGLQIKVHYVCATLIATFFNLFIFLIPFSDDSVHFHNLIGEYIFAVVANIISLFILNEPRSQMKLVSVRGNILHVNFEGQIVANLKENKKDNNILVDVDASSGTDLRIGVARWNDLKKIEHRRKGWEKLITPITEYSSNKNMYRINLNHWYNHFEDYFGKVNKILIIAYWNSESNKTQRCMESLLLLNESSQASNKLLKENLKWNLESIFFPALLAFSFSGLSFGLYLIFHKWVDYRLQNWVTLQILLNYKDNFNLSSGLCWIEIACLVLYVGIIVKYVIEMMNTKLDEKARLNIYRNYISKILITGYYQCLYL